MSTSPRPAVTPQAVVGVSICLMGIALTLDNLGIYEIRSIGQVWPVVPISIGLLTLMYGETKQDYVKGTLWLSLGVFFIIRHPFVREVWPILLVALGGYLVWRSRTAAPKRTNWEDEAHWDYEDLPPPPTMPGQDPAAAQQTATAGSSDPAASAASTASTASAGAGTPDMPPGVPPPIPPIPEEYHRQYRDVREVAREAVHDARQAARDALREVRDARRRRRSGPFGCGPRRSSFGPPPPGSAPGTPGAAPGTGGQAHEFSFAGFPPARPVPGTGQRPALFALMAGVRRQVTGAFAGAEATAIMGGVELDLRYAQMDGDQVTIDTFALWGGIEIWVPPHWNIVSQGLPLMASFEDKTHVTNPGHGPRLVIRGVAVMGSVEIKN
jgi:hypothetical protein